MSQKKKFRNPTRTLFDLDCMSHRPKYRKYENAAVGFYPTLIEGLEGDPRFGGSETSVFSDVCRFEQAFHWGTCPMVAGAVTIQIPGKRPKRLTNLKEPVWTPHWVESDGLRFSDVRAKGILLCSWGSICKALQDAQADKKLDMILVSGSGVPRMTTRRVLHRLSTEFNLPVYLLNCSDTWGYFIFSVLKRGMLAPHMTNPYLAIPNVRYLGMRAGDHEKAGLKDVLIPWESHWALRIKKMREYPCFKSRAWQHEFDAFTAQRGKVDISAFPERMGIQPFIKCLRDKFERDDYLK